jgi:hypothetical protein
MPILASSSTPITMTKDDPHLLSRSRRSAQSFQTSFAPSRGGEVRDAGMAGTHCMWLVTAIAWECSQYLSHASEL